MLAIPLASQDATTISKLYGQTPYFALLDESDGSYEVLTNSYSNNGIKGVEFLIRKGVSNTVFYHMGKGLFERYAKSGVNVFTVEKELLSIKDIYEKFLNNELRKLNQDNCDSLLDSGNCHNECGCQNGKR